MQLCKINSIVGITYTALEDFIYLFKLVSKMLYQ